MAGIADFLDSLIGGFDLMCFALLIGGLLWGLAVLKPWRHSYPNSLLETTLTWIYRGGLGLVGAQLFKIVLKIWLMMAVLEKWPFPEFAATSQFIGGIVRAALTLLLSFYVYKALRQHPHSLKHWLITTALAVPMLISGAWLVHAAGRFDDRLMLMALTVAHQIGAAAWIGGVFMLVILWRLKQAGQLPAPLWPEALLDFGRFGIGAVALILLSGLPIALKYIDSWNGLVGTGYGNLLMVKIILLVLALTFAAMNHRATRDFFRSGDGTVLERQVPYYIEAEAMVLVTLLFTAASLASQPPAIDIPNLAATWRDVLGTFTPQFPQVTSPTHSALLAGEAGRVAIVGQIPSLAATEWSNYNHNISGIFITTMSFFAMLSYSQWAAVGKPLAFSKFWPVGFVMLGIFLFFRSDAETWPLGPIGFWESTFNNGEVLQHRIATLLVFTLGVYELKARKFGQNGSSPYVFPILSAFGGLMLLTHSHIGFQPKSAFLIQVGHTTMGIFSLILACGRWLELKLDSPAKHLAGFISVAALFQIGIILMFYREPLY